MHSLHAQAEPEAVGPIFTYRDALLGAAFVATGLLAYRFDERTAHRLQDSSTQANRKLQSLATFVRTTAAPGAYYIGGTMYVVGRLAKNDKLASLGLHGTEGLVVGQLSASVIKMVVGRQRPYVTPTNSRSYGLLRGFSGNDFRSFPSGHTVAGFAAAAAVTAETSRNDPTSTWIVAPLMYGGAALVGVSRMYNNQHWASDVVIGAAIGTFAGLKVVRYHDAHPHSGLDRLFLTASMTPGESGGQVLRWAVVPGALVVRR